MDRVKGTAQLALVVTGATVLTLNLHHHHKRPHATAANVIPLRASRTHTREPLPVKRTASKGPSRPRPLRVAAPAGSGHTLDWDALAECEASGNPRAVDPTGTYFGLYQFDLLTWRSVGGRGNPANASRAEQTFRARILFGQRGRAPWPVCGVRL